MSLPSSLLRPDPPVSTTPTDFPGALVIPQVCARRPGLGCLRDLPCFRSTLLPCVPSPLRREEERRYPSYLPAPKGFPQQNSASAPPSHPTPASVGDLLTTLQRSLDVTARKVASPPGLVRPGVSSGRRGRIHPSLPEAGHPHPESGMTTPPFWGRTMTGLAPAGALPLQAARSVAKLPFRGKIRKSCIGKSMTSESKLSCFR